MSMKRASVLLAFCVSAAFGVLSAGAVPEPHPWSGKKVVYLGDSITDPTQITRHGHGVYWKYMQDLYGIEPLAIEVQHF